MMRIDVLTEADKETLHKIKRLTASKSYPPVPSDIARPDKYRRTMYRLYKLQRMDYIELHYERGRVRAIELLAMP